MILLARCGDRQKEYMISASQHKAVQLVLRRPELRLRHSVALLAEPRDGGWALICGKGHALTNDSARGSCTAREAILHDGGVLYLHTPGGETLRLISFLAEPVLPVMEKYALPRGAVITIGSAQDNAITYRCGTAVRSHHAELRRQGNGWFLHNRAADGRKFDGLYVNGMCAPRTVQLHFGDRVELFGLKLVYCGTLLLVSSVFGTCGTAGLARLRYNIGQNRFGVTGSGRPRPYYNRAPRNLPTIYQEKIRIDSPPPQQSVKKRSLLRAIGPSLTMAIPMLIGCMMMVLSMSGRSGFLFLGVVTALGSALLGAVWAIFNIQAQEEEQREEERKRFNTYGNRLIGVTRRLAAQYKNNYEALHRMYPAAERCAAYTRADGRLWSRNATHGDFLFVRLGLGDIPFQVEIETQQRGEIEPRDRMQERPAMIEAEYRTLRQVPVGVDLLQYPLLGVVGQNDLRAAIRLTQVMLTQIAVNICYTDVKIALINRDSGEESTRAWDFLRWLPHCWSEGRKMRLLSASEQEAQDVCYELLQILGRRTGGERVPKPYYIVVVTEPELLKRGMLAGYLLQPRQGYGMSTLLVSDAARHLPNSCPHCVETNGAWCFVNNMLDVNQQRVNIRQDQLPQEALNRMARRLANIQVEEKETVQSIPTSMDFLSMYGVTSITELELGRRWSTSRIWESMRVPIGIKAGGKQCCLDIHEKFHGPHGLVAGTTGSGKSETLQSYILSLCVNFSPEDITFFLIDYKGGSLANLFENLPHLAGRLTNLSGNQTQRAMLSIQSEIQRRQRLFHAVGVNSINQYTQMYKGGECEEPIPHLCIIIDEFAELKKERPEFMRELISVAQVGRSLGIHLILAAQKPSGTVDDNIRANARFRLCLRVQDKQDSKDMLHRPDAAYITQVGACILQVGNDEVFELFQSAWSGAIYDGGQAGTDASATLLTRTGQTAIAGNRLQQRRAEERRAHWYLALTGAVRRAAGETPPAAFIGQPEFAARVRRELERQAGKQPLTHLDTLLRLWPENAGELSETQLVRQLLGQAAQEGAQLPELEEKTQLDALIEAIAAQAASMHLPQAERLWLPPLPHSLSLEQLPGWAEQSYEGGAWRRGEHTLCTVIGLLDDPENRTQTPLRLDLLSGGHHAILGTVASGKSTLLQTALYGLVSAYSPKRLNLYIVDFSARMLSAFEGLPHVGGVVLESEAEKLDKLFVLLEGRLQTRKERLRGGSFAEYSRLHPGEMPAVVLVIDNYAGFKEKTEGRFERQMMQLSREGVGYGIYLLLTASGFGMAEISTRMGENLRTVLCLELPDKFKYMEALHVSGIRMLPESGVAGRGLMLSEQRCLEYQTALMNSQPDDYTRLARAQQLFERMRTEWDGVCAPHIPEIPKSPTYSLLAALPDYRAALKDGALLPIGYDRSTAELYSISLPHTFCYLILGRKSAGKSNVLQLLLQGCAGKPNAQIALYTAEPNGALAAAAHALSVRCISTDEELLAYFTELTPLLVERTQQQAACQGLTGEERFAQMQAYPPLFLLIDDLKAFLRAVYQPAQSGGDMHTFVENLMDKGAQNNLYLFGTVNIDDIPAVKMRRAFANFTRDGNGMLLGVPMAKQRILKFEGLSFAEQSRELPRGTAVVTNRGADGAKPVWLTLPLAGR